MTTQEISAGLRPAVVTGSSIPSPRRRLPGGSPAVLVNGLVLAGLVVLFELLARSGALGPAVPPLSAALMDIVDNWGDYSNHLLSTCLTAAMGLAVGAVVGIIGGIALSASRLTASLSRGLLVVSYCAPLVVLLPILISAFSPTVTRLLVIVMMIAFPLATAMAVGIANVDAKALDLVRASGGGRIQQFALVKLPNALPDLFAGLQVAFPAAILGAMLAELAGGRWGLGLYLIAGVSTSNNELVWGVALLATSLAAAGFLAFGAWGRWISSRRNRVDSGESALFADIRAAGSSPTGGLGAHAARTGYAALAILTPLVLWWLVVKVLALNPIVMKGPQDVWQAWTSGPRAPEIRERVTSALADTLTWTALGFAAGLIAAVGFAVVLDWRPRLRSILLPPALLSQTVPLIALVPILLVSMGRGRITLIVIGVIITFFPAFVMISQGLSTAPNTLMDVIRSAGGGPIDVLLRVKLPHALPHLTAAARLLAPRALLGIILAEFIATGTGLGFVIYESRGSLDYATMWIAATAGVLVSCLIFWLAGMIERATVRRFAGG